MSGNVWEWVQDWYNRNYYRNSPSKNPKGFSVSLFRVLPLPRALGEGDSVRVDRGGSWNDNADYLRSAIRGSISPDSRLNVLGFRLAKTR